MTKYLLTIMVVCIFATGCIQQEPIVTLNPSTSCEQIIHPALLTVPFDTLIQGQEEAEAWIVTQFPTATVKFEPSRFNTVEEIGRFAWSFNEKVFSLYLATGTRFIDQSSEQYPTLGSVLRCYGDPGYYTIEEAPMGVDTAGMGVRLDIWYPDQGLRFRSETWGATEIRRYDANSPLVGVIKITPPGMIEEMIRYGGTRSKENVNRILASLQEWPDNFTELVLEE